ncbi:ferritin-like domain-containing protein [Cerioporus squamosus]|nr:ferritin-like domain-containing protein [Cerioporus squamosus]
MFTKILLFVFAAFTSVHAAPVSSRGLVGTTDTDMLQYALFLEHLENAFYSTALAQFNEQAFADAGYDPKVRAGFVEIGQHEAAHVKFLSDSLGSQAREPCVYTFPSLSVGTFIALSKTLENIGDSAYIEDPSYLTSAATILSIEARHASWVAANAARSDPFPKAFDTPLPTSEVVVEALAYVVSCPQLPPVLPFADESTLILSDDSPAPRASVVASFTPVNGTGTPDGRGYIAWLNGSGVQYSELGPNGETTVPHGLNGTVYALAVSRKEAGMPSATNFLSGLTVAQVSQKS